MPEQHHAVFLLGIGAVLGQRFVVLVKQNIVFRLGTLQRQHLLPPAHDPVVLREEPVSAQIHTVAVILNGLRYAAYVLRCFAYYGKNVRLLQQFVCGCQTGRAGAYDHRYAFADA